MAEEVFSYSAFLNCCLQDCSLGPSLPRCVRSCISSFKCVGLRNFQYAFLLFILCSGVGRFAISNGVAAQIPRKRCTNRAAVQPFVPLRERVGIQQTDRVQYKLLFAYMGNETESKTHSNRGLGWEARTGDNHRHVSSSDRPSCWFAAGKTNSNVGARR